MSALSELNHILECCRIPVETGVFSKAPPETYAVLTPLIDVFDLYADNMPGVDISEVRISIFTKKNYLTFVSLLVSDLLTAGFMTEVTYLDTHSVIRHNGQGLFGRRTDLHSDRGTKRHI